MRNSWLIAWNLVKRTIGTWKGFIIGILLPTVVIAVVLGFAGGSVPSAVKIGYVDHNQSLLSKYVIDKVKSVDRFELVPLSSDQEAGDAVIEEEVRAAFIIPEAYETHLLEEGKAHIQQIQMALSEQAAALELVLNQATEQTVQALYVVQEAKGWADLDSVVKLLDEHQKRSIRFDNVEWNENVYTSPFSVIGFMLMFLMILINQSITTIVEDRRDQLTARVYAAPVNSFQIALGNFLGSMILGTIQVLLIMTITRVVFDFSFGGPFWLEFIILECFILAVLGLASAVGGMVKNADQLGIINTLVMTPTCMLGGCFWPVEFMPEFMQKMSNFMPQKWAIDATTSIAQGNAITDIALHLGILLLFAAVLLGFGASVLKPSEVKS